ncbi:hypothetical protein BV25DRAFT_1910871 [Artomyces pyxidatus]|uniref:Uncharacterized protein n=1 Tax=Artomyces pyxidatus TaxID=48021 RepID=A0ACB8TL48_9AGAM|nr:hypothetical protein BV25DRAFT_1910871 [Artomyces pyxidatus]
MSSLLAQDHSPIIYPSVVDMAVYLPTFEGHSWDIILVGAAALLYFAVVLVRRSHRATKVTKLDIDVGPPSAEDKNIKQDRIPGLWTPVDFAYPSITPLGVNIEDMPVRPYRPFKAGPYRSASSSMVVKISMGIRNMDSNDWIEPDSQFPAYHRIRAHRIATQGHKLIQVLPDRPGLVKGGADAAKELMYELAEFLSRRCPKVFRVSRHPPSDEQDAGWYGEGKIKDITILPLDVTYNLDEGDPMTIAALLVQDDLAIMIEGSDGQYYLQAGAIVIPGSWRLRDKIGMPMDEIHTSGNVPHYEQKLQPSLSRFFRRLTPSGSVARDNWLIQVLDPVRVEEEKKVNAMGRVGDPEALAWNEVAFGPEDDFPHPLSSYALSLQGTSTPALPVPPSHTRPAPVTPTPQTMRLRAEHETLRRLPRTGAVIFTIRTHSTPIEVLGREPGIPGRLAAAVRGVQLEREISSHRRQETYEQPLLDYLDKCHREQVEAGVVNGTASEESTK